MARYYMGIDLGDGETAVAYLDDKYQVLPEMANLGYPSESILSAVGETKGEPPELVIGDNVALQDVRNRSVRFKSRFLDLNSSSAYDVERFAKGLRRYLELYSGLLVDGNEVQVALGCPAGWEPNDRARYARIVRGVFPQVKEIPVSESRAAFLYAKYTNDLKAQITDQELMKLLNEEVLVIDVGSSTTDFAYIVGGRERDLGVFGEVKLGGGLIDQYLLEECVAQDSHAREIRQKFEEVPSVRHRCELTARKVKEDYFNAEMQAGEPPRDGVLRYTNTVYYGRSRSENCDIKLHATPKLMERVLTKPLPELKDKSFKKCLKDALDAAVLHTKDAPPKLIILTGGASRMPFLQEAVRAKFPNAHHAFCNEPEFSIAKGLALASRVDSRIDDFYDEFDRYLAGNRVSSTIGRAIGGLAAPMASNLAKLYVNSVLIPELMSFLKKHKGRAREDLERQIASETQVFLNMDPQWQAVQRQLISSWQRESDFSTLEAEIREICDRYEIPNERMPVPQVQMSLRIPAISLSGLGWGVLMSLPFGLGGKGPIGALVELFLRNVKAAQIEAAVVRQMLDVESGFYMDFYGTLVQSMKDEIHRQVREVEIPII